jgi:hypothetical protein
MRNDPRSQKSAPVAAARKRQSAVRTKAKVKEEKIATVKTVKPKNELGGAEVVLEEAAQLKGILKEVSGEIAALVKIGKPRKGLGGAIFLSEPAHANAGQEKRRKPKNGLEGDEVLQGAAQELLLK